MDSAIIAPEPVKMAAANLATAMAKFAPRAKKMDFRVSAPCDIALSKRYKV
jgi:hypothetical protein